MKKLLSVLMAAAMLTVPAAAAETEYKMGDVNMDGCIDSIDAQLVLVDYVENVLARNPQYRTLVTEEQIRLANINLDDYVSASDAQLILLYYTESLADKTVLEQDIVAWAKEKHPSYFQ